MNENKDITINGKALYTPKGAAREYGRIGCNFYTGCPHECQYCYLKRGAPSKQLGGTEVRLKKCFADENDALFIFKHECEKHIDHLRKTGIFFSFTTDPMLKETYMLTLKAAKFALECGIPVKILTKCANVPLSANLLLNDIDKEKRHMMAIGFTLTGRDDMEPNADPNAERIDAMRRTKDLGFSTFASIEPVIEWRASERVVREAMPWCDHFKLGLRSGVKKDYYNIAESGGAIQRIVTAVESFGRTIYLKESTRKLLQQYLQPGAYEVFLTHTVDMDGNRIV